jgi:predicted GNAT family acetyltransferase
MASLRRMTEPEYDAWLAHAVATYAADKTASGQWALHVFGHNTTAQALYAKLGYSPTNINLFKALGTT